MPVRSVGHMGGKYGVPQLRRGGGSQWRTMVGFVSMTFEVKSFEVKVPFHEHVEIALPEEL